MTSVVFYFVGNFWVFAGSGTPSVKISNESFLCHRDFEIVVYNSDRSIAWKQKSNGVYQKGRRIIWEGSLQTSVISHYKTFKSDGSVYQEVHSIENIYSVGTVDQPKTDIEFKSTVRDFIWDEVAEVNQKIELFYLIKDGKKKMTKRLVNGKKRPVFKKEIQVLNPGERIETTTEIPSITVDSGGRVWDRIKNVKTCSKTRI